MSKMSALGGQGTKTAAAAVGAAALVAAASYFGVVSPQLTERTADIAATEQANKNTEAQTEQAELLAAQAGQLDTLVTSVNSLTVQFPDAYDQGDWLAMIQEAANISNVKLDTLAPDVPIDPALIDPITGVSSAAPPVAAPLPGTTTTDGTADSTGTTPDAATPDTTTVGGTAATDAAATGLFPIAQAGINLTATGTTSNLVDFLARLGELERPVLTDQVKIVGNAEEMTLTVVGHTYLTRPVDIPEALQGEY